MLCSLRIKNLALMDAVTLELSPGFTVVTGETGAGKSVLLGALSLLAGNRAGKTIIRKGADVCEVEAVLQFDATGAIDAALEALEMPPCDDGQLILRRQISATKTGRVAINGTAATLAQLEQLSHTWIDFHGPGEPQKLFHARHQLAMLDLFAGAIHQEKLARYGTLHAAWKATLQEIENIAAQEKMSADEIAFVQAQLDKMALLDLSDEGVISLENDFKKISSAQELSEIISRIDRAMGGDGLMENFPSILRDAREISAIDAAAAPLESRLNAVAIELSDIQSDYARLANDTAELDVSALADVTEKMNLWLDLRRKYGTSAAQVRAKRDALKRRLEMQNDIAGTLARAGERAEKLEGELRAIAADLHATRVSAAVKLSAAATKMLVKLGFKKADICIQILDAKVLNDTGADACDFLFSSNAGQDLLPLNKIASSGETARVMLALKTVLVAVDKTPVLVFDEVDANVGGEIGAEVGRELAALAGRHQVFCVTHLPQVAAQGDQHFEVVKTQTQNDTAIFIREIQNDTAAREAELARMLGDRKSVSALNHARELLLKKN